MAVVDPAVLYQALRSLPVYQPANILGLPSPNETSVYSLTPRTVAALALAGGPARNIPGTYDALIGGTSTVTEGGSVVPARNASRIAMKDRFSRSSNWANTDSPGPARAAERADAMARALVGRLVGGDYKGRPIERGTIQDSDVRGLDALASQLLGEEPISARTIDESVSPNALTGEFTSEDPTLFEGPKQASGDINPFYTVDVPARIQREGGKSGTWTVDTGRGFRPAVARIDPSQVIDSVVQNPRRGPFGYTGESDNTASFQREKPVSIGDLVKEVMDAERTPVISESALSAARSAGRARALPPDERQGNLVGYMKPPGSSDEVPVYAVTGRDGQRVLTSVERPDPENPLRGTKQVEEALFRVGYPYNRSDTRIREQLAPVLGVSEDGMYGPAPMLGNQWDRVYAEKSLQSPKLERFLSDLSGGSFMLDPDEATSSYKTLASALLTGQLEVAGERPFTKRTILVDPGAILSLQGPDGRPLFAPGSNARNLLQQAVSELQGGREVDLFSEAGIGEMADDAASVRRGEAALLDFLRGAGASGGGDAAATAAEAFGYGAEDDFARSDSGIQGRYGDFGDVPGGVSIKQMPGQPGDALDRIAVALTGDDGQGLLLADVARRSSAPAQRAGVNAYGSTVGPVEELPARNQLTTLLELAGRRSPVTTTPGAQQVRRKYQGDFSSTTSKGQPVTGQAGYGRMAEGLGAAPGSAQNEKALALLAKRIRGRSQSGGSDAAEAYRAQKLAEAGGQSPRAKYSGGAPDSDYVGLGAIPGSWQQERAMNLLAGRLAAQKAEMGLSSPLDKPSPEAPATTAPGALDQSMLNSAPAAATPEASPTTATGVMDPSMLNSAPTPGSDPEAMARQAGMQRLQRRRQGYVGGIGDRFVGNFGSV